MFLNYNKDKYSNFFAEDPFKKDVDAFTKNIEAYLPKNIHKKIKKNFLKWISSNLLKNKKYLKKLYNSFQNDLNNNFFLMDIHRLLLMREPLPEALLLLVFLPMVVGTTDFSVQNGPPANLEKLCNSILSYCWEGYINMINSSSFSGSASMLSQFDVVLQTDDPLNTTVTEFPNLGNCLNVDYIGNIIVSYFKSMSTISESKDTCQVLASNDKISITSTITNLSVADCHALEAYYTQNTNTCFQSQSQPVSPTPPPSPSSPPSVAPTPPPLPAPPSVPEMSQHNNNAIIGTVVAGLMLYVLFGYLFLHLKNRCKKAKFFS